MNKKYSIFLNEHFKTENPNSKKMWVKSYTFYHLDVKTIDIGKDWRFKEVKNKRKESIYLGECEVRFPIKYPIEVIKDDKKFEINGSMV